MRKLAAALTLGAIVLSGCAGTGPEGGYSEDRGVSHVIPDNNSYVKDITVNGHQCIIFRDGSGDAGVAISCDWSTDEQVP